MSKHTRRMAKEHQCNGLFVKETVEEAMAQEEAIRAKLYSLGMSLEISWSTTTQGTGTAHWMVNTHEGERVVNYWPGTGRFYSPVSGEKGKITSPQELADLAVRLVSSEVE